VGISHLRTQTLGSCINKILSANYQIPKHVSPECKDLFHKILNTDPSSRITISEIRKHPWYKLSVPREKEGIIVGVNKIPVSLAGIKIFIDYMLFYELVI